MNGRSALSRLLVLIAVAPLALSESWASDRELASAAGRGEVAAFEELFRANQARIYALCLRMTADPARAEDLTQESFVRAWRKLDSFRGDSSFLTWLHRLTVNVVLGDLRSRGRWEAHEAEVPESLAETRAAVSRDPGGRLDLERAIAEQAGVWSERSRPGGLEDSLARLRRVLDEY